MDNCLVRRHKIIILKIVLTTALLFMGRDVLVASAVANSESSGALKFTPQVGIPGFMSEYVFEESSAIPIAELMKSLLNYGVQVIGLLAMVVIMVGGLIWATAGGNSNKTGEAKQWIFSGLGGLMLILFSYVLLRTINIKLVNFNIPTIETISGTKINIHKSNQQQIFEDVGYFDGSCAATFGNPANNQGCCIAYNSKIGPDTLNGATLCWQNDKYNDAAGTCDKFIRNYVRKNTVARMNSSETLPDVSSTAIKYWTLNEFKKGGDFGYFIRDTACWNLGDFIKNATKGLDDPTFCQNKQDGWSCMIKENNKTRKWGYCENKQCRSCLIYGSTCTINSGYACPDSENAGAESVDVQGYMCGNRGTINLFQNSNSIGRCYDLTGHGAYYTNQYYEETGADPAQGSNTGLSMGVCICRKGKNCRSQCLRDTRGYSDSQEVCNYQ